jgi:ribosome assembly protein RRB1
LEWDPYDESTIAVSGADGQITIWDMSVEKDEESGPSDVDDIPPQLLFVHQGQMDTKELHHHAQIPGVLLSTAEDGFDIFRPSIETEVEER